jgi:hypothetical protein
VLSKGALTPEIIHTRAMGMFTESQIVSVTQQTNELLVQLIAEARRTNELLFQLASTASQPPGSGRPLT